MDALPPPIITQEVRIIDAQGHTRLILSAKTEAPTIQLLRLDGKLGSELSLDDNGRPAIKFSNPDANGPSATLEIDDKGAHAKFDLAGGASSYLFLNNAGGSGLALIDAHGVRRLNAMIDPNGVTKIEKLGPVGEVLP